jgi:hypothetical protein
LSLVDGDGVVTVAGIETSASMARWAADAAFALEECFAAPPSADASCSVLLETKIDIVRFVTCPWSLHPADETRSRVAIHVSWWQGHSGRCGCHGVLHL